MIISGLLAVLFLFIQLQAVSMFSSSMGVMEWIALAGLFAGIITSYTKTQKDLTAIKVRLTILEKHENVQDALIGTKADYTLMIAIKEDINASICSLKNDINKGNEDLREDIGELRKEIFSHYKDMKK